MGLQLFDELPGRERHTAVRDEAETAILTLRSNPNMWGIIWDGLSQSTAQARASMLKKYTNIEAATRKVDGDLKVFARYVGLHEDLAEVE